jgi:hypothetical protein
MTLELYVLHALGWSLLGGVVGVLLDRAVLALQQIARTTPQEESVHTSDRPTRRQRMHRWFSRSVVPAVLIVLALGTVTQGFITAHVTKGVQDCQLLYANRFADAIDARADATREAQDSLDELMATVGELTTSAASPAAREKFTTALSQYLVKRETSKQKQRENPYPPAPRDLCE